MNLPRIVADNSAVLPTFVPEPDTDLFDAGRVNAQSRALVQAIFNGRVKAFAPPSFYREFLNVAAAAVAGRGGRMAVDVGTARTHWEDVLRLPFIRLDVTRLLTDAGELTLAGGCPAADSWHLAAARFADATLWVSHRHADGFADVAAGHVPVRLLCDVSPAY